MEEDLQSVLDIMYQPGSSDKDSDMLDYLVGIYWII